MKKLIFVHIPKTGGTSMFETLKHTYSRPRVSQDKSEAPAYRKYLMGKEETWKQCGRYSNIVNNDCIIGHFPLSKYQYLKEEGWLLATWVRDPVRRVISHYNHIKRKYDDDIITFTKLMKRASYNKFLDDDFGVLDFVGFTETYKESLKGLNHLLGTKKMRYIHTRVTMNRSFITSEQKEIMKEILVEDYEIYNELLKKKGV